MTRWSPGCYASNDNRIESDLNAEGIMTRVPSFLFRARYHIIESDLNAEGIMTIFP